MNSIPDAQLLLLAFAGSALISLILLTAWIRARRQRAAQGRQLFRVQSELAMIQAGNIGLGKKLLTISRQLEAQMVETESLRAAQNSHPATLDTDDGFRRQPPSRRELMAQEGLPEFDQAQMLLRQGVAIDSVVRQTGLTRSEAELIQLLNQPQMADTGGSALTTSFQ